MLEEQEDQELVIYEDTYHKEMWNNIVEEINKIEYGKEVEFKYFGTLKEHCYDKLNYKGKVPFRLCFACEYAKQFNYKNTKCEYCPFEGIDSDKSCLNNVYDALRMHYDLLCVTKNNQIFDLVKQECIELSTEIRDWKVKEGVLCRSNIK